MTVKDFVLRFINNVDATAKEEYERDYTQAVKDFVDKPYTSYKAVRKLYNGDIALFMALCMYCRESIVFNHRLENWKSKVKPKLRETSKNWYHISCLGIYS